MTELSSNADMTELSFSMSANVLRTNQSKMDMKRQHDSDSQGNPCGHGWSHTHRSHMGTKRKQKACSFSKEKREENKTDSER